MLKTKYFSIALFVVVVAVLYFVLGKNVFPNKTYLIGKIVVGQHLAFAQGK